MTELAAASIFSTGPYTAVFTLFGPTMSPPESIMLQGIELDTQMCAVLTSMTGYDNGGLYEVQADYTVVDFAGGRLPPGGLPIIPTNVCHFGSVNYTALP